MTFTQRLPLNDQGNSDKNQPIDKQKMLLIDGEKLERLMLGAELQLRRSYTNLNVNIPHIPDPPQHEESTTQPQIILGTQPGCGPCKFVKTYLKKHNISFTELDLSLPENKAWIDKLDASGMAKATPVIYDGVTGDPVMSGRPDMAKLSSLGRTQTAPHQKVVR